MLCQWRKLKGHCRRKGFSSWLHFSFISSWSGAACAAHPKEFATHPREFEQPPYGSFPMNSTGATASFPERPAMKWLPSKFNNTPSDSFQTNFTWPHNFISTLADSFLLASPSLLPLGRLLHHSVGYRNPLHRDLNLYLGSGGWAGELPNLLDVLYLLFIYSLVFSLPLHSESSVIS